MAYGILAPYYDRLMEEVDYHQWLQGVARLCDKFGKPLSRGSRVLDLACGTGSMTYELAAMGANVTGVDLAGEMLAVADQKIAEAGFHAVLLQQDMRTLSLTGRFSHGLCLCDSLNYLLTEDDLRQCFRSVSQVLEPGGLFVFDLNTEYKLREVYGDNTYAERFDDFSYIWENAFDPEESVCQMDLFFYILGTDGRYDEFCESHLEKAFSDEMIRDSLGVAGLMALGCFGDDLRTAPTTDTERITYVVAKPRGTP